jgi:hypothetical protein
MPVIISKNWFRLCLLSLSIVALFGTLMRYKIAFEFPWLEQKNLLHAHSHFAFSGWVSQFLYSAFAMLIAPYLSEKRQKNYNLLLVTNLLCAFGMLIAFTVQGYKVLSISLSTFSIVIALLFAIVFIKDAAKFPSNHPSKRWAIAALILNLVASAGPLYLANMMMSRNINHDGYLGSIYYYLHFQYSGWFFFGCMALVAALLPKDLHGLKSYFWVFFITAIATVFLSLLWAKLPLWLVLFTALAAVIQLVAWLSLVFRFFPILRKHYSKAQPAWLTTFLYGAALAMTIKFILQAISSIPSLSQLVFGFRPIVIGYLHLVLLGVYSLFIIGYSFAKGYFQASSFAIKAALAFFVGVILNEVFLGVQGMAAFTYTPVPYINELLLLAALVLFSSAVSLAVSQRKRLS